MIRKSKRIIFLIIILALVASGTVFLARSKKTSVSILKNDNETAVVQNKKDNIPSSNSKSFFISGWMPYWRKTEGTESLQEKLNLFSEINPFSYGVNLDGSLVDKMQITSSPWPELFNQARERNVKIVPTILWGDAVAMHKIFSSPGLLDKHANAIVEMLKKNNFPGVDIDYEGKDIADKDNFTLFLKTLSEKLAPLGKSLNCTVEARTEDTPPAGFSGTRAMSWANDYQSLNNYCGSVRIMAYDQVFQIYRANTFETPGNRPLAPNAGNDWVAAVMEYALRYITPDKLIMGIPTYGWEFSFTKTFSGYNYQKIGSINYPAAIAEAKKANLGPTRNEGGELDFTYKANDVNHIVTFEDAESVKEKINMAKDLHLLGVSLFKIDGFVDPEIFSVLAKAKS